LWIPILGNYKSTNRINRKCSLTKMYNVFIKPFVLYKKKIKMIKYFLVPYETNINLLFNISTFYFYLKLRYILYLYVNE